MSTAARLDQWLESVPDGRLRFGCLLLVFGLGVVDWWTGREISFAVFYALPVVLSGWHGRRRSSVLIAVSSAAVWAVANELVGEPHTRPWIGAWNAGTRLVTFAVLAVLAADLRALVERERRLARIDVLTGLDNRRSFSAKAQRTLSEAAERRGPVAILCLDVDDFKRVNDTRGHAEGDALLAALARSLQDSVRATDTVGRLGGDEFAILFPGADEQRALELAGRVRHNANTLFAQRNWPVSLSVGLLVLPTSRTQLDEVMRAADALMYQAKHAGKDQLETLVLEG